MSNFESWAEAISLRIADEWSGKEDFPDDAKLLQAVLEKLLKQSPSDCKRLIGTGIIEEDYFSDNLR
jgi:hypothetical protein